MKKINLKITLCYQHKSEFYSKLDLLECVSQAVNIVNSEIETFNLVFEEIEEGNQSINIHENVHKVIEESHLVIFEISDLNKNVLYELGLAKGLRKKFILIREEGIEENLPFDISPFQFMTYSSKDLISFKNHLAGKIKRILQNLSPENILSQGDINNLLAKYIVPIKSNSQANKVFNQFVTKTELNFYYLGTIGFLTNTNTIDWIEKLTEKRPKPNIYRIVYLKSLKEVYEIYENSEVLEYYCFWLAKYYIHVKLKNINLFNCPDVGIWKAGMSVITSDENEVLILTGNFEEFNTKGVWIKHEEIGAIFKEYSKVLAVAYSNKMNYLDMIKLFNLSDEDLSKNFLEGLPKTVDDPVIEDLCRDYIERAFLK